MRKLNIRFSDCYWPRINGVSASMRAFSLGLRRLGWEVLIVAPSYGSEEVERELQVLRLPSVTFPFHREDRVVLPLMLHIRDIESKLRGVLGVVHVETFFGVGILGMRVARKFKLPLVFTYHTYFEDYVHYLPLPQGLLRKLARAYSKWFSDKADLVIAPSQAIKRRLREYGVERPITVLPSPINPIFYEEPEEEQVRTLRERLSLNDREMLLCWVGRLGKEKNVMTVLRAFELVSDAFPETKLVIVGDGPLREEIERYLRKRELTDKVILAGYLSQEELRALYQLSDIMLFASKTETQGLVLAEAMARGCVPVAIKAQGVEDVVTPESGILVEVRGDEESEARALAEAASTLLREPERLSPLSEGAMRRAQYFHTDNLAGKLVELYEDLVRGGDVNERFPRS